MVRSSQGWGEGRGLIGYDHRSGNTPDFSGPERGGGGGG